MLCLPSSCFDCDKPDTHEPPDPGNSVVVHGGIKDKNADSMKVNCGAECLLKKSFKMLPFSFARHMCYVKRVRERPGHVPGAPGKAFLLVWPLELGLRTLTLQCGHLSSPSRTRGGFFDFEVDGHDGAYKGRVHVIVPFAGRKNGNSIDRQQSCNVLVLRGYRRE